MVGNWFPRLDMKTRRFVYQISVLSIKTVIKSFLKKYFEKNSYFFRAALVEIFLLHMNRHESQGAASNFFL